MLFVIICRIEVLLVEFLLIVEKYIVFVKIGLLLLVLVMFIIMV